jgi:hypothetical protein
MICFDYQFEKKCKIKLFHMRQIKGKTENCPACLALKTPHGARGRPEYRGNLCLSVIEGNQQEPIINYFA